MAELVAVLDQVRHDPRAFVVRGALTAAAAEAVAANPNRTIKRRKHLKGGIDPTLAETPRRWVMIDIDNWPLRGSDDLAADPASAIDAAIYELLPAAFHDAECWWQLSASAGFVPGYLKAHLFFWLSEPAGNDHIKATLKQHAPGIDRAPFSAAQPHYIADPIIDGFDPCPQRTGWRKGMEPCVALPQLVAQEPRAKPLGTGAAGRVGGVEDALMFLGHGEGGEGFHAPLRTATMRYAQRCQRYGDRDDAALKADLRDAIRRAPCRPGGNVEQPYCQDAYLDALISGAFALLAGDAEIQSIRPHHAAATHTLEDARAALAEHVSGFVRRTLKWGALDGADRGKELPEHAALVVGVGTGKTTVTREALPGFIEAAKAAGQPHRVLWLAPTHKLGRETLEAMRRLGLNAEMMLGRDAIMPGTGNAENYVEPTRMCLNLEAVEDALSIVANVERSICGSLKAGDRCCPWRKGEDQCAFQRQKPPVSRADVVIVAHQSLFHELAKEVRTGLGMVIVDESWWQAGLIPYREINLGSFAQEPLTFPVQEKQKADGHSTSEKACYVANTATTADLHTWSAQAQRGCEAVPDGELVSKAALLDAGLTAQNCADAYALEWRRMYEGVIYPGQPAKQRREALKLAAGNAGIPRRAAFWRAAQALIEGDETHTGRLQMGTHTTAEGSFRTIILHSRLEVRKEIAGLPMLHLDATMPLQVVRHFLPRIELLADVQPVAPYMEVHQIIGGWGKTSLVSSDKAAPEENQRREGLVNELSDFATLNGGGNAVVITYEAIEKKFDRPGLRTGHFNAVAGLDEFRDVRSLFVIGRPLPDARELREQALALTGRAIAPEAGQVETRGARMIDGSGAALNVRAYRDADMEALRVAITEAEITQAIGRGRGVNRTAENPLAVFLFADVATALPITRMVRWADIRPGVKARMASRGLVLFGPADAARIYGDLFPTQDAGRMAIQRDGGEADFPNIPLGISNFLGECSGNRFVAVSYRPAGRGQQNRRALVAKDRLEALAGWLTERLGAPVRVEVLPPVLEPDLVPVPARSATTSPVVDLPSPSLAHDVPPQRPALSACAAPLPPRIVQPSGTQPPPLRPVSRGPPVVWT